jgi:hypothetical protein
MSIHLYIARRGRLQRRQPEVEGGSKEYAGAMSTIDTPLHADAPIAVPAVLDIEASGFGRDSYPVEIGFVLPDGQTYCSLIRPAPDWTHWDPGAERVHHITLQSAIDYGRDVVDVARQLNERLRGRTIYCDGWAHDYVWLNVLFEAAQMTPAFKLDNLRALLTDQEASSFDACKHEVETEMSLQRHRASSDAAVLQRTLVRLRAPVSRHGPC